MSTTTRPSRCAISSNTACACRSRCASLLTQCFPTVAPDAITGAIHDRYAQFDGIRIRYFVPVLVERSVRADLAAGSRL